MTTVYVTPRDENNAYVPSNARIVRITNTRLTPKQIKALRVQRNRINRRLDPSIEDLMATEYSKEK